MKFILFFVLFSTQHNDDPVMFGHKLFPNEQACLVAKEKVKAEELPTGTGGAATCISENDLLELSVS